LENDGSERENRSKSAAKLGLCAQTAKCFAIFLALSAVFRPAFRILERGVLFFEKLKGEFACSFAEFFLFSPDFHACGENAAA